MKLEYKHNEIELNAETLNNYYKVGLQYDEIVKIWQNLKKEFQEKIQFAGSDMVLRAECDSIMQKLETIQEHYPNLHKHI